VAAELSAWIWLDVRVESPHTMSSSSQQQTQNGNIRSQSSDKLPLNGRARSRSGPLTAAQRRQRSRLLCGFCAMLLLLLGVLLRRPDKGGSREQSAVLLGSHGTSSMDGNPSLGWDIQYLVQQSQQGAATASAAANAVAEQASAEQGSQQPATGRQQQVASTVRAIAPQRLGAAEQPQRQPQGDGSALQEDSSHAASSASQRSSAAGDPQGAELTACMRPADAQLPAAFSVDDFLAARPARHEPFTCAPPTLTLLRQ
jgi:hypothetical protein